MLDDLPRFCEGDPFPDDGDDEIWPSANPPRPALSLLVLINLGGDPGWLLGLLSPVKTRRLLVDELAVVAEAVAIRERMRGGELMLMAGEDAAAAPLLPLVDGMGGENRDMTDVGRDPREQCQVDGGKATSME